MLLDVGRPLSKPAARPEALEGGTASCCNRVTFPFMLSLSKHDIDLGNSPSTLLQKIKPAR
jgi:hypothetical protein